MAKSVDARKERKKKKTRFIKDDVDKREINNLFCLLSWVIMDSLDESARLKGTNHEILLLRVNSQILIY